MEIKKYFESKKLGDFESFNSEFEIDDIEHGNLAKQIASRIVDKVDKFRKLLEEYLHADGSNIAVLMEIKGMDDSDKDKINDVYKDMILIERAFFLLELSNDEDEFLKFIKESSLKWNSMKPKLMEIIKKAKSSWENNVKVHEDLGYLG